MVRSERTQRAIAEVETKLKRQRELCRLARENGVRPHYIGNYGRATNDPFFTRDHLMSQLDHLMMYGD